MISDIVLSSPTVAVGEILTFKADGIGPIIFQVRCFVERPRPRGFRECPECQPRKALSGETLTLIADPETWQSWTGRFEITATDSEGDTKKVSIPVINEEKPVQADRPRGREAVAQVIADMPRDQDVVRQVMKY